MRTRADDGVADKQDVPAAVDEPRGRWRDVRDGLDKRLFTGSSESVFEGS